jgi:DNA-binding response OmpR family regulator
MRKNILLVEDDEATRGLLSTLLERTGYDVVATDSVQEGKSLLEEGHPDLLITDIRLGAFNGLQLIAMSPRRIPAIVTTGFPDPVLEAEARQSGGEFLLKPIEPRVLLKLLSELLGGPPRTANP